MPHYVVDRVEEVFKKRKIPLKAARILIIGVTYKKDVKNMHQSPALDILKLLQQKKAKVSYHDPLIPYLRIRGLNLKSTLLDKSLRRFHIVVIATDHSKITIHFCCIIHKSS